LRSNDDSLDEVIYEHSTQYCTRQLKRTKSFGDIAVNQWQQAGLLKPSVIKPIVTTIEKFLVIKTLGRLNKEDRKSLGESFYKILGE